MDDHSKDIQDYFNQGFRGLSPTERTVKQILDGNNPSPLTIRKDPQETTSIGYDVISSFEQNYNYQSPIEINCLNEVKMISEHIENKIHNEIVHRFGVFVDKEELVKALNYDRGQYEKGWNDGYNEATKKEIKTNFARITESEESLAEFLGKIMICDDCPIRLETTACKCYASSPCPTVIKEWLQKECER